MLDVRTRAERIISRLGIRPAMLCRCVLTAAGKKSYDAKVVAIEQGRRPYRTKAAL